MKTATKYLILFGSMALLILSYVYVVFWSERWKWRFWVSGRLDDLVYLTLFTLVWVALLKAVWRLEVRLLLK